MNIQPSEAGRLTLAEYQGLLWNWNEMHKPAGERDQGAVAPPDADRVRRNLAALNARTH